MNFHTFKVVIESWNKPKSCSTGRSSHFNCIINGKTCSTSTRIREIFRLTTAYDGFKDFCFVLIPGKDAIRHGSKLCSIWDSLLSRKATNRYRQKMLSEKYNKITTEIVWIPPTSNPRIGAMKMFVYHKPKLQNNFRGFSFLPRLRMMVSSACSWCRYY